MRKKILAVVGCLAVLTVLLMAQFPTVRPSLVVMESNVDLKLDPRTPWAITVWEYITSGNPWWYWYGYDGGTSSLKYGRVRVDALGKFVIEAEEEIIIASDIGLLDDLLLTFGTDLDASIEYDEDKDDLWTFGVPVSNDTLAILQRADVGQDLASVPSYSHPTLALYGADFTDYGAFYHNETDFYIRTLDGAIIAQTDEATNTATIFSIIGKGTQGSIFRTTDADDDFVFEIDNDTLDETAIFDAGGTDIIHYFATGSEYQDDIRLQFGNDDDAGLEMDTTGGIVVLGIPTTESLGSSKGMVICDNDDVAFNHGGSIFTTANVRTHWMDSDTDCWVYLGYADDDKPNLESIHQDLHINYTADMDVNFFTTASEGETMEVRIYGYKTGDSLLPLEIGVGVDTADTASFDGLSNYWFDGAVRTTEGQYAGVWGDGNGVSVSDDPVSASFVYGEIKSGTTLSAGKVTRGAWNRLLVNQAQTNQATIVGTESQIRVKQNMADGVHAGLWAYFEQDGTVVLSSPGQNAAISATVEGSDALTLNAGATLSGIVIDSSVHNSATLTGDFDAIWVKASGSKYDWKNIIQVSPDGDQDVNLIYVDVTGAPIFKWDESSDMFQMNFGLEFTGTRAMAYSGTPTQAIASGIIEIGDYTTPLSIASPTDHLFAIQANLQLEGSVAKWYSPAYFKVATDGSNAATLSSIASLMLRATADQALTAMYGVQSHITVANANVSGYVKAGSFKADKGAGATAIAGEVSALEAILDGAATQGVGRANAFMAVVYSAVTDADEIGYFTANASSTVGNGIYIANHGTMTNAIQINSAGGTLVDGLDLLGTFSGYGLDLNGATCSTADIRLQNSETISNLVNGTILLNSPNVTIGVGAAGVDYTLTFDGEDNDGVITWDEDNDVFNMACDLTVSDDITGTIIHISETTTPTAVTNYGALYTKTDNNLYFQDGANIEHAIGADYAGMSVHENGSATDIALVDAWEKFLFFDTNSPEYISDGDHTTNDITIGSTGDYSVEFTGDGLSAAVNKVFEFRVFELSSTTTTITAATAADPVVITAAGHGFTGGERVAIKAMTAGGMVEVNDRIFTVADVVGNTFELCDDGGTSPGDDIDGTGFAAYTTGGTVQEATQLDVFCHRKFAVANDLGRLGGGNLVSLTSGNILEVYIKGDTDATNFTFDCITMRIIRIN